MSLVVLLECRTHLDTVENFKSVAAEMLVETRQFPGCESVDFVQGHSDPTEFVLLERWGSADDHDRYIKWRRDRGDLKRLVEPLSERAVVRRFDPLEA